MGNRAASGLKGWRAAAFCLCIAGVLPNAVRAGGECSPDTVFLKGDWGQARFTVEIADDPEEMARGLMHRENLAMSAGMLFVYTEPRRASFWMRNTLIPLDMLFIDAQGVVQHIHHMAVPLDETPIPSEGKVQAVLEINGGLAARLGIEKGAAVRHPVFAWNAPVWPC